MDLYTPEDLKFRDEIREFFSSEIPMELRQKVFTDQELTKEEMIRAHKILYNAGYAVTNWPVKYGGKDWTPVQRHIFGEEMQMMSVPGPQGFNTNLIGPVLCQFGSDYIKDEFLEKTAALDIWWSQGFSEPNAGSDLANLQTRAKLDGDHYVVNGQKTWTTMGQYGDWIFTLVRTSSEGKKQQGITMLLIDMKDPGVTVRPIQLIDGGHDVNEVFFDNVMVPVENRVGEENMGWTYAKYLLGNERTGIARVGSSKNKLGRIKALAAATPSPYGTMMDDPAFAARITQAEVDLTALEWTAMRVLSTHSADADTPDPRSSVLKLKGAPLQQTMTELLIDLLGPDGVGYLDGYEVPEGFSELPPSAVEAMPTHFGVKRVTIYGGSNEVQRMIISKAILGV